jgi:hypothetical protein
MILLSKIKQHQHRLQTGTALPFDLNADNKFESVDNEGRVCNLLHTDKGSFRLEDFDFESKTSVFLMVYMHGAMEFKK